MPVCPTFLETCTLCIRTSHEMQLRRYCDRTHTPWTRYLPGPELRGHGRLGDAVGADHMAWSPAPLLGSTQRAASHVAARVQCTTGAASECRCLQPGTEPVENAVGVPVHVNALGVRFGLLSMGSLLLLLGTPLIEDLQPDPQNCGAPQLWHVISCLLAADIAVFHQTRRAGGGC